MSDLSDFIAEMDRDEENRTIEDEKYFQVSDEKFQEMQKRLQLLTEENKRQMDIIMNSLDELIANKAVVDKALDNADEIEPIVNDDNLSIVDLLAKVTGYINDTEMKKEMHEITNNLSMMHDAPEDKVMLSDEEKNDAEKLDLDNVTDVNKVTSDIKDCEKESESKEISKNEDALVTSKVESEKKEKETELCDSTILLEKLNIGSSDGESEDPIISDEAK